MSINPATDPAAWWDNQIDLHPPSTPEVADLMDQTRATFKAVGLFLIRRTPPGADLTVALRALKDASQAAIGNIACHQDEIPAPDGQITRGA